MKETDYRKLSPEAVFAVKKTIIKLYENRVKTSEIQKYTGMCINSVRETIRKYKESGIKALQPKKVGRPKGSGMTLAPEQCLEIQEIIIDKNPEQLKFSFALWNRKAVKELIEKKYGVVMPIRTVGEYLKRWGFTPQKPAKVSRRQNPKAIKKWLNEEYPKIRKQAKSENALIF